MDKQSGQARPYRIIVACGTAIATSTHVSMKVKEVLAERGLKVRTIQCRVPEVPDYADEADLVVSTAQVPYELDIPVIDGVPFLSGVGMEEVVDRIERALTEGDDDR